MTKHFHLLFLFVSIAGIGFSASAIELIDTFKTDASVYRVFPEKTEREKTVKSTKLDRDECPGFIVEIHK